MNNLLKKGKKGKGKGKTKKGKKGSAVSKKEVSFLLPNKIMQNFGFYKMSKL